MPMLVCICKVVVNKIVINLEKKNLIIYVSMFYYAIV